MPKEPNLQLEMFSQSDSGYQSAEHRTAACYIKGHEKLILSAILFLVTAVAAFSLGVKHGKKIALRPGYVSGQNKALAAGPRTKQLKKGYTVQIGAYKSSQAAAKASQDLRQKGVTPRFFSYRGYTILCAGNFRQKSEAETLLMNLKKTYTGCFIRRL